MVIQHLSGGTFTTKLNHYDFYNVSGVDLSGWEGITTGLDAAGNEVVYIAIEYPPSVREYDLETGSFGNRYRPFFTFYRLTFRFDRKGRSIFCRGAVSDVNATIFEIDVLGTNVVNFTRSHTATIHQPVGCSFLGQCDNSQHFPEIFWR